MCVCVCVSEAQGTFDVLPIAQVLRTYDTRHPHDALIIDSWAQIFAVSGRHINHIATRPQSPHTHTTQSTMTSDLYSLQLYTLQQGFPDRGPRAQIWAPDRLFLGPLGLKYMHWIWAFGP